MISFSGTGDFAKTSLFLKRAKQAEFLKGLEKYGSDGVAALAAATPTDSGVTASSWSYKVEQSRGTFKITWTNSNINHGVPIAIILQYGHGTGTGGWVQGRDYINPAIRPVFDRMINDAWGKVKSL